MPAFLSHHKKILNKFDYKLCFETRPKIIYKRLKKKKDADKNNNRTTQNLAHF